VTPIEIQNEIIPKVNAYAGFPVIEGDQPIGSIPDGRHAVFTFLTPHGQDTGGANYSNRSTADSYEETRSDDVRVVMSFTAIDSTTHGSISAAQAIREWFEFYGDEDLYMAGIALVTIGDIGNRNSINEDERRNGFDITLRVGREMTRTADYIETIQQPIGEIDN
jgi:hypothetical protein